jgi:uncharacterized membrane protein
MSKPSHSLPAARPDDTCSICGKTSPCRPLAALSPSLRRQLEAQGIGAAGAPGPDAAVCSACLSTALSRHTLSEFKRKQPLSDVEDEIAARAAAIADEVEHGVPATFGHRAADVVTRIGGSWAFVLSFIAMILGWGVLNVVFLRSSAFDPYPFIFLNLVLSSLSSLQAPIILMSQSRMAQIDRIRGTEDFRINLKAELEIASLHEKMDHLMNQQWDRMLELQQVQLEILEQLHRDKPGEPGPAPGDAGGDGGRGAPADAAAPRR